MRGLLIKDCKLIKMQKNSLLIIIAIAVMLVVFNDDTAFLLGFLPFVMSMIALSTITYDEFDNGNAFLFTLPISRVSYVVEKYVFSLLSGIVGWGLATLLSVSSGLFKGNASVFDEVILALSVLPVMLLLQTVTIPFQLKFGGEKGRIAMSVTVGLLFVVGMVIVEITKKLRIDFVTVIDHLPKVSMEMLIVILLAAIVGIFLVSMKISISIIKKKEF